jgi:hypothetical protein
MSPAGGGRCDWMLGRDYLARQVRTLLKMARITRDPKLAAGLAVKASDLKARLDATPLEPPETPARSAHDMSPRAPDVDTSARG